MKRIFRLLTFSGIILVYLIFTKIVAGIFLADYFNEQAKQKLYIGHINEAKVLVLKSIKINAQEPAYHRTHSTIYLAATLANNANPQDKETLKSLALKEAQTAYHLQPYNLVNIKNLIPMYYLISLNNPSNAGLGIDEYYKKHAIKFYDEVSRKSPNDADFLLQLGKYYLLLDESEKAKNLLNTALALKPDSGVIKEEIQKIK